MFETLQIRTATVDDGPAVKRLLESSYPALLASHYDGDILSEALPILCAPRLELLSSGRYYIAEHQGAAVACGGWSLDPPGGVEAAGDVAVIRRFAVVPELAGKGLGRRLFQRCERDIGEQPVERMLVRSSLNAEAFYGGLGFRRLHPIGMPLPSGRTLPCVLMQRWPV